MVYSVELQSVFRFHMRVRKRVAFRLPDKIQACCQSIQCYILDIVSSIITKNEVNLATNSFLDTANLNEIKEASEMGLIDGVTTNPSLVSKEGKVDFKKHIAKICELTPGDVSAEVTSLDTEGMLKEGREYAKIATNVVIK